VNRRDLLKGAAAGAAVGAMALWAPRRLMAQQGLTKLTDKLDVIDAGGANVTAFVTSDGLVVVDSGATGSGDDVMAALRGLAPNARITTLFNTHYHLDQTANNEMFAAQGAKIVSQKRTKEWMSRDYWNPAVEQYVKARPKAAVPTETFVDKGTLKTGGEEIGYGYLLMAHTSGDCYVHFKSANVIAVGDVASPLKDPELDWFTGGWVGGRVDSMDLAGHRLGHVRVDPERIGAHQDLSRELDQDAVEDRLFRHHRGVICTRRPPRDSSITC